MKKGLQYINKLHYYVSLMTENELTDTTKKELESLMVFIAKNSLNYYFVYDELNGIIVKELSCSSNANLTFTYNIDLIFDCLKQYRFIYKQTAFLNMPKKNKLFERQLIIVAQYFLPNLSYSIIKTWLDNIAEEVKSRLKDKYPTHEIFSTSPEQFFIWKETNIDDHIWTDKTDVTSIMSILEEYIFSDLNINDFYKLLSPDFIAYTNSVSEHLRKHILTNIYRSTARRLGVRCDLAANYETTISIAWKPEYKKEDWDDGEYFYLNKGPNTYPSNITKKRCPEGFLIKPLNDVWMVHLMMTLFHQVSPRNIPYKWKFNIFSTLLLPSFNLEPINIEIECKKVTESLMVKSKHTITQSNQRKEMVKYAVGMIVRFSSRDYRNSDFQYFDGVIIDWHYYRNCPFKNILDTSRQIEYMYPCENCLPLMIRENRDVVNEPHYTVLTDNNTIIYHVIQNEIFMCPPREINNIEIGRYFSKFEGTHYVLNKSLADRYPEDSAAIVQFYSPYFRRQWQSSEGILP
ncbi:F-box only protein 21-like isoform X2 [Anoplolepis gracilipes]